MNSLFNVIDHPLAHRVGWVLLHSLWQGALIAVAGSVFGCLLGALMTWGVSHIPIRIRGLLYTDYFLVTWDWRHYVFATLLAILAVFIASYVPARRAAELPPVVTLRGSSV